jgi:radical SAM-linked protein
LGFTSQNDLLDFWLDSDENLGEISKKLERALQPGITVQEYQVVPAALKPLQTLVTSAEYLVRMETESIHADLTERIEKLLRQNECLRERRGKQYDLRPLIESLQIDKDDTSSLLMTLAARPGATGRPEEVLDALGIAMQDIEIMRSGMILSE